MLETYCDTSLFAPLQILNGDLLARLGNKKAGMDQSLKEKLESAKQEEVRGSSAGGIPIPPQASHWRIDNGCSSKHSRSCGG